MLHIFNEDLVIYLQDVLTEAELVFHPDTLMWCLAGDALTSQLLGLAPLHFGRSSSASLTSLPDSPARGTEGHPQPRLMVRSLLLLARQL